MLMAAKAVFPILGGAPGGALQSDHFGAGTVPSAIGRGFAENWHSNFEFPTCEQGCRTPPPPRIKPRITHVKSNWRIVSTESLERTLV